MMKLGKFGQSLSCTLALLVCATACTHVAKPSQDELEQTARFQPAPVRDTITRAEVIKLAKSYAEAAWQCSDKNADEHFNRMRPGMAYTGVAYNWGGWDTVDAYQKKIKDGTIAGTTREEIHPDFAGVDCSGFVSRCWGLTRRRYSTYDIHKISKQIKWEELKPGDILNRASHHVRLFEKYDEKDPDLVWVYESTGDRLGKYGIKADPPRVIHRTVHKSTMMAEGYIPRRYNHILN